MYFPVSAISNRHRNPLKFKQMKKLSLIYLAIGYLLPSTEIKAQWVYKLNAKNEVRIVYEVPRLSPYAPNNKSIPAPTEKQAKLNIAANSASNIVGVEYAYSEGFSVVEEQQGKGKWGFMRNVLFENAVGNFQDARKFREGMAGIKLDGKWGFVDRSRAVVITPTYDDISYFSEGLAGVSINKKYGFVDKTGRLVIPIIYDDVTGLFDQGKIKVTKNKEIFFINRTGERVLADYKATPYTYPSYFAYGVSAVKIWDKWAFYSEESKMLTPFIYSDVIAFNEGLAGVKLKDKWGFIDIRGKEVILPDYDEIASTFENGVAIIVKGNDRYGIDKTGKRLIMTIPLDGRYGFMTEESGVFPLFTGYNYEFSTDKPAEWGFMDKSGKMVIPLKITFQEGLSKVNYQGKWGFVDTKGKLAIPLLFDEISSPFQGGLAMVVKSGKQFTVDVSGKQVGQSVDKVSTKPVPAPVDDYWKSYVPFLVFKSSNGKYGFKTETGSVVITPAYDYATAFENGYSCVLRNNKQGFIDMTGRVTVPIIYENAKWFTEGLAAVKSAGKWGFIDIKGTVIIPFQFDDVHLFKGNVVGVQINNKWGFADKTGELVIGPIYNHVGYFFDGLCVVRSGPGWGYINEKGEEIISPIYQGVGSFIDGKVEMTLNGIRYWFDKTGKKLSE